MGATNSSIRPHRSSSSSPSQSPPINGEDDDNDELQEPNAKRHRKNVAPEVSIEALQQIWDLEIESAKKSPVLKELFHKSYNDNVEGKTIKVNIQDPDITVEGLHQIFLFLCNHEININIDNVQNVMSASLMLKVDGIMENCIKVYRDDFSKETILDYYKQSLSCNIQSFKTAVFDYLYANFCRFSEDIEFLNVVNRDLLKLLISDGRLCVPDAEYSVYKMVKRFIMLDQLRIHDVPVTPGEDFPTFISSVNQSFTPAIYYDILQEIRISHCVNSIITIRELTEDKLIPEIILKDILSDMWITNLDSHIDIIDKNNDEILDIAKFNKECMRFGKLVEKNSAWYWFRCIFGVDLEFKYVDGKILVKRKFKREQITDLSKDFYVYMSGILCSVKGKIFLDVLPNFVNITPRKDHFLCNVPEELQKSSFMFHFMILPISRKTIPSTKKYFEKHIYSKLIANSDLHENGTTTSHDTSK
uniref:BTB domain-containing protein n=1 Tax=Panagrolaimus sp. PS1159 TaxID=55785 RepID=A0AC35FVM9_9BILA